MRLIFAKAQENDISANDAFKTAGIIKNPIDDFIRVIEEILCLVTSLIPIQTNYFIA